MGVGAEHNNIPDILKALFDIIIPVTYLSNPQTVQYTRTRQRSKTQSDRQAHYQDDYLFSSQFLILCSMFLFLFCLSQQALRLEWIILLFTRRPTRYLRYFHVIERMVRLCTFMQYVGRSL